MAKKKVTKKEVSRKELNGVTIITFDDGSIQIIPAPIDLTAEEAAEIFGTEEDEDDEDEDDEDESDEDEDDEDEDEEEEEEITGDQLMAMDFEELEDLCEDKDLETDPDDFEEEDIEKLRKEIAKEMGITLPKASKKDSKKKKK